MKVIQLYENSPITLMIRDTLYDPGGRTFLVLVFVEDRKKYTGYIQSPYISDKVSCKFCNEYGIIPMLRNLAKDINEKDRREELIKTYSKWIRSNLTCHADWAIHFWEREDDELEGRIYDVKNDRESVFYNTNELTKILTSMER